VRLGGLRPGFGGPWPPLAIRSCRSLLVLIIAVAISQEQQDPGAGHALIVVVLPTCQRTPYVPREELRVEDSDAQTIIPIEVQSSQPMQRHPSPPEAPKLHFVGKSSLPKGNSAKESRVSKAFQIREKF
jgi:hypothetical protein